jgi:hypothetical protein
VTFSGSLFSVFGVSPLTVALVVSGTVCSFISVDAAASGDDRSRP